MDPDVNFDPSDSLLRGDVQNDGLEVDGLDMMAKDLLISKNAKLVIFGTKHLEDRILKAEIYSDYQNKVYKVLTSSDGGLLWSSLDAQNFREAEELFKKHLTPKKPLFKVSDTDLNKLCNILHGLSANAGWWKDAPEEDALSVDVVDYMDMKLALVTSELSEALEGVRKGLMDDHLPHRLMVEVELADACIRIFDYCGYNQINFTPGYSFNKFRNLKSAGYQTFFDCGASGSHIRKASAIHRLDRHVCQFEIFQNTFWKDLNLIGCTLAAIVGLADGMGLDLDGAIVEKAEYNLERQDHKEENREKVGGKLF